MEFVVFFGQDESLKPFSVDALWTPALCFAVQIGCCTPTLLLACLFLTCTQLSAWCRATVKLLNVVLPQQMNKLLSKSIGQIDCVFLSNE